MKPHTPNRRQRVASDSRKPVRSVLQLDQSLDSILIARSMLEGLSQLLWAAQAPEERPLRWRTFSFVLDWRLMRKRMAAGEAVTEDQRATIENGLKEHGRYFLTSTRDPRESSRSGTTSVRASLGTSCSLTSRARRLPSLCSIRR